MPHEEAPEFANVTARLLKPVAQSRRNAITNVDPLGVIERFSFANVASEATEWAQLVRENGLQPDDRVVVLAGPEWEWRCALLGVLLAGGVGVPCQASGSEAEIQAIAADAGAKLLVSVPARPELVKRAGPSLLSADERENVDRAKALAHPPHPSTPQDVGLVLYPPNAANLPGVVHTHGSLIAQAEGGEHWLGIGEDERVWSSAPDGSSPSIWLLLAAWRARADIVSVNLELEPEAQLELLDRIRPAAVWFSDDEYGVLASATAPAWIDLAPIHRALVSDESSAGATAFADAFGATVTTVFALNELGVVAGWPAGAEGDEVPGTGLPVPGIPLAIVDEQGAELPTGQVGEVVVRGDAQSLFSGYTSGSAPRRDSWLDLGWQGALGADGSLRLVSGPPLQIALVEAEVDLPVAEPVDERSLTVPGEAPGEPETTSRRSKREAKRARREAKAREKAEERRRREEQKGREDAERAAAKERKEAERAAREAANEEERRRAEEAARAEREAAEAEERRQAEEAARAQREATAAEERRRAKEAARAEREAAAAEERRRAEEAARAEREAEERRRAEEAARAEREAAAAEERRRAEEAARAEREAEERRRAEEAARAEREAAEAEQRRLAEEAARAEREAAEAEGRRRAEEEARAEERSRAEEERRREKEEKRGGRARHREEKQARRRAEQEAKAREKADATERAQREAQEAAERNLAEEAARADERRRAEDEKRREREEKKARRRQEQQAKEAARAERKAARRGRRLRAKRSERAENERREEDERERLDADVVARIRQYGAAASRTEEAREPEAAPEPSLATEPNERQDPE
jgi:acyl-CoA synthetase (AMP-forming)/AMP-acid ligase II